MILTKLRWLRKRNKRLKPSMMKRSDKRNLLKWRSKKRLRKNRRDLCNKRKKPRSKLKEKGKRWSRSKYRRWRTYRRKRKIWRSNRLLSSRRRNHKPSRWLIKLRRCFQRRIQANPSYSRRVGLLREWKMKLTRWTKTWKEWYSILLKQSNQLSRILSEKETELIWR